MTPSDDKFLDEMLESLTEEVRIKFITGKIEHGGHIWEIPIERLITEAKNEALDQFTYIYTLEYLIKELMLENERLRSERS